MDHSPFDRRAHPAGLAIGRWLARDGWPHRRFDWPAAGEPRGSLIFQSGRSDFLEKYLEAIAHWQRAGWSVSGFDWRGQGGSGRTGSAGVLDHMVDDLDAFIGQWIAETPGPHVLVGHSMGGHVALRLAAERAPAIDALILSAPMLGLGSGSVPPRIGRAIAATLARVGLADRPAWADRDEPWRQEALTSCVERYRDSQWWKTQDPSLALGTPSWGWISEAYRSIATLMAPGVLERVAVPTLIVAAARDRLVETRAIEAAARRIPGARLAVRDDAAHELLREADGPREAILAVIDAFLDEIAA